MRCSALRAGTVWLRYTLAHMQNEREPNAGVRPSEIPSLDFAGTVRTLLATTVPPTYKLGKVARRALGGRLVLSTVV